MVTAEAAGGCWGKKKEERVMESEALHQPDSEEEREEKEEEENAVRELSWKGGREGKTPRGEGGGWGGVAVGNFQRDKMLRGGGWRESVVIYGSLPPPGGWMEAGRASGRHFSSLSTASGSF